MSIKKQFLKAKPVCKVTFRLSESDVNGAKNVQVLGSFNDWNLEKGLMKKLKTGGFSLAMDLETGNEYQFRYLLDGESWVNEPDADAKQSNEFGEMNDILSTII